MGSRILATGVAIGIFAVAEGASGQGVGQPQTPTIQVLVMNQAVLRPEMLRAAEADAGSIFEAAGVHIVWLHLPAEGPSNMDFDVVVRIAPRIGTMRAPRRLDEQTLGLAGLEPTDAGPRGRMVWVFFDRVEEHASRHHIGISRLCGLVMAHEIGHLMLPAGHSERGVMRGTWELRSGLLEYFTDPQADAIRTRLATARVP